MEKTFDRTAIDEKKAKRAQMNPADIAQKRAAWIWQKCESKHPDYKLNWTEASAWGAPEKFKSHFFNSEGKPLELSQDQIAAIFEEEIKERIAFSEQKSQERDQRKKAKQEKQQERQEQREEKRKEK